MESTSTWRGTSTVFTNSSFVGGSSNIVDNPSSYPMYSSFDSCYQVRGVGLGSSPIETDTFLYPNTPLISGRTYQIRFKLASFGLNPASQTAAGVDQTDWFELQYSLNNGTTWWRDAQIQGFGNAMWSFDGAIGTNAKLNVTRTGNTSTTTPIIYVSNAGNPIVNVSVTLPFSTASQLRIRFITQINATGETFMLDNVEIIDLSQPLPIDLLSFTCEYKHNHNVIEWEVASQTNNDYFTLYRSLNGFEWREIERRMGEGTTTSIYVYEYVDREPCEGVVYYKLKQTDYDGKFEEFGPIASYCVLRDPEYVKWVNYLGQSVNENFKGPKIHYHIYK